MSVIRYMLLGAAVLYAAHAADAAELKVPKTTPAGTELSIPTSGSGKATMYVVGPGTAIKREARLGEEIKLTRDELKNAGRYTVIVSSGGNADSASFFVTATKPETVSFLARPSRVPTAANGAISGTAFVFDKYNNLVRQPTPVKFDLSVADGPTVSRTEQSKNGVAWLRLDSGRRAGAAQFVASIPDNSVRRVVQETAADPCNIRMKASRTDKGILVETDPVRDCSGNPVPDGTIVTFTSVDANGKSTVDSRIKKGIAKAELPASSGALISVASGVVVGNEIRWGGGQ